MNLSQSLDLKELGNRIKTLRIQVLSLSQEEFAAAVNATQVQISRLESGAGITTNLLLDIINYLNNQGYKGCMLLDSNFDTDSIISHSFDSEIFIESLKDFKNTTNISLDSIINKLKFL